MRYFILIFIVILSNGLSFAQNEKRDPGIREAALSTDIPFGKSITPQRVITGAEKKLSEQLLQAKEKGSTEEMLRIQREMDSFGGSVTTKGLPGGTSELIYGSVPSEQSITATKVINLQGVRTITILKEQIGTSNRMWAVAVFSAWSAVDTIYSLYSDDEGNNWNFFSRSQFHGAIINLDQIDAEIVQTPTATFLYIIVGVRLNHNYKEVIGMVVNQISSTPSVQNSYVTWPGETFGDNTVRKYRPRITSDCAQYQYGSSWLYIACCQDSAVTGGYRTCVKTARVNDPYTPFPSVTSMAGPYYFNDFVTAPESYVDLAYYRDVSGGSIVILQSGVPVNSYLYMTKSLIGEFTTVSSYMGSLDGGTGLQKKFGCISSNGYYQNLMITDLEFYSSDDFDIQYFTSSNSGAGWSTGYVDFSGYKSYRPDMMERKNIVGEFYIAYADILDTLNIIRFSKAAGSVWGPVVPQMNHINASPYPRPCYRTSGPDNCFVIWNEIAAANLWVSAGCSGSVVLNNNLKLNLYIQGRYRPSTDKMVGDTFQIQIRNNFSPYAVVGTAKSFQGDDGIGSYNFPTVVNGTNYYIAVRHRNSIETWSKSPGQSFSAGVLNYNFFSLAQAYGNNLVEVDEVPYRFGIYTGDVNQDGIIDASDIAIIDNSAFNFLTGYVLADLTGDYTVDGSDYAIADNNAFNFVSRIRP